MKAIDVIYNNLMNGGYYGYMVTPVRYPYFYRSLQYDGKYFLWHVAGSSAVKATKDDLAWLIENIFKITPEKFIDRYQLRHIDLRYDYDEEVA